MPLYTQRLYMRPFELSDAVGFFTLNNNPLVLMHTGDMPFENIAAAQAFIATYDHYECYGYGRWAVVLQSNQQFIGFCGLKYHPESGEVDLGYRMNYSHWGKGYATEAAQACLDYGLKELKIPRIIGRVRQANLASVKVLEKIGMQRIGAFDFEGHLGWRYAK